MIISKRLFFSDFDEYAIYCGITWRQTNEECFDFITFHYSNCCILPVQTMQNNSKTDRIKSAQYKVESWHHKKFNGFCLWTENLLKNPTNFSSMHVHLSCHRTKMSSKLNKMSGNENKIAEGEWGRDETTKPIRRHIVPTSFVLHCLKSISIEQWNEIFLDFYNKELGQILLYI